MLDTQYRVVSVLCHAQYGDILLCEVAPDETCATSAEANAASNAGGSETSVGLAVVKQICWSRVQAKQQQQQLDLGGNNSNGAPFQLGDDPMLEMDVVARICRAGHHKNVIRYYKVLRSDRGSFGIVMEYCNEGDLLRRLDQLPANRLSEAEALVVLRQIATGLRFLHDVVGVAHRDVSLENVMVHNGVCKLGDFGLSARIDGSKNGDAEPQRQRQRQRQPVHGRVGKLGYMAPEVAAGDAYDPVLADMWSLGVSFFILLTGSPLVESASLECAAFRAFCHLGLRRVLTDWKMIDDFHDETIDLAERMLQVHPTDRITLHQVLDHPAFRIA